MQNLIALTVDKAFNISLSMSGGASVCVIALIVLGALAKLYKNRGTWGSYEINEAEFGIGDQKIKLSPNLVDRQIAYKVWIELSTRKIGLPIDLDHDVIAEIYDSWFNFFSVTRELIKDVPVQKFGRSDTEKIVRLSIDVLNLGLRPHLTKWQARFRRWYERQLRDENLWELHPQDLQKRFPLYQELEKDLTLVNERLISYRLKMLEIVKHA